LHFVSELRRGNPLIDLATGLGNSFLIIELGCRFCSQDRGVLVLSHVPEIIIQDVTAIGTLWPGGPIGIANKKWRLLGGPQPAPTTVADALARQHEISSIAAVGVQRDREYWRVVDVRLAPDVRSAA
jgi:hypothetical protein